MNRSYMNSALAKLVLAMAIGVDKRRARRLYRRARKSARDKAAIELGVNVPRLVARPICLKELLATVLMLPTSLI